MKKIYISLILSIFVLSSNAQGVTMIINNGGQPEIYENVDSITFPDYRQPYVLEQRGNVMFPYSDILKSSYQLSTLVEEISLKDDFNNSVSYSIKCYANSMPQTLIVHDEENVYMLAREVVYSPYGHIDISEKSSALAMVTMHPILAPISGSDYNQLLEIVIKCKSYNLFEKEVSKAIQEGRPLFDDTNESLIACLDNVLEEILDCFEEPVVSYNTGNETTYALRKAYGREKMYPFYSELNENVLTLRNTGLTPSYYGTVSHSEGTDKIAVLTRPDYGFIDLYLPANEANLGPRCNYTFTHIGSYKFSLSRMGPQATLDFYINIVNSILSGIGLEQDTEHILNMAQILATTLALKGIGVYNPDAECSFMLSTMYEDILNYLRKYGSETTKKRAIVLLSCWNVYNKLKATGNTLSRIYYGFSAPKEVNFTLNYDGYNIDSDFIAEMEKVDGDNQIGKPEEQLPIKLKVKVRIEPEMECNNLRVSFNVSGGGKVSKEVVSLDDKLCASVSWTLGRSTMQRVRADLVDIITGKSLSSAVFNADIALDLSCPDDHHPHIIDLGLPSGLKWACCNVGASKPEEYGGLYSWGETNTKERYDENDYKHYEVGYYAQIKNILKYSSKDGKTILDDEDDAATVHMGDAWRMPTKEEMSELWHKCTWTRIDGYNIRGFLITGLNGNKIFLPAGGMIDGTLKYASSFAPGTLIMYWGCELCEDNNVCAWVLGQSVAGNVVIAGSSRHQGMSIRGVR